MHALNVCCRVWEIAECHIKLRAPGLMRVSPFCSNELFVMAHHGTDASSIIAPGAQHSRVLPQPREATQPQRGSWEEGMQPPHEIVWMGMIWGSQIHHNSKYVPTHLLQQLKCLPLNCLLLKCKYVTCKKSQHISIIQFHTMRSLALRGWGKSR